MRGRALVKHADEPHLEPKLFVKGGDAPLLLGRGVHRKVLDPLTSCFLHHRLHEARPNRLLSIGGKHVELVNFKIAATSGENGHLVWGCLMQRGHHKADHFLAPQG